MRVGKRRVTAVGLTLVPLPRIKEDYYFPSENKITVQCIPRIACCDHPEYLWQSFQVLNIVIHFGQKHMTNLRLAASLKIVYNTKRELKKKWRDNFLESTRLAKGGVM